MEFNERVQKYIESFPPAVQGEGGQTALFNAALKLTVGFDLTAEQVTGFLWDYYNPRCVPPWNDGNTADFIHQCEAAWRKAPAERGKLLESGERSRPVKRSQGAGGSQAVNGSQTAPALSLVRSQGADGSQAVNGSQAAGAKRGPVRRINLIQTKEGPAYRLMIEWLNGSLSFSVFPRRLPDCYVNEKPAWDKVKREWLFEYAAPDSSPFMLWLRLDFFPDKNGVKRKSFFPFHYVPNSDGTGGEFVEGNDPGGKVFPFGVARFPFFENLIFTEGEKAAVRVNKYLLENRFVNTTVTCLPNGAKSWRDDLKEYFRGKNVFVWPDNDETGKQYAANVCGSLEGVARSVWTLKEYPPGFNSHDDAVEVFQYYANQGGKDDDQHPQK